MARVTTHSLKHRGLYMALPIAPSVEQQFRDLNLTSDYGVAVVSADEQDEDNLHKGLITEFVSYNRTRNARPGPAQDYAAMLTVSHSDEKYGLDGYTEAFEKVVLDSQGESGGLRFALCNKTETTVG
ncbi:MAG: hypothetical protein IPM58_05670 [Nitrospira sp.]|nr:hypothetical protein [Nitrospira sp.]